MIYNVRDFLNIQNTEHLNGFMWHIGFCRLVLWMTSTTTLLGQTTKPLLLKKSTRLVLLLKKRADIL